MKIFLKIMAISAIMMALFFVLNTSASAGVTTAAVPIAELQKNLVRTFNVLTKDVTSSSIGRKRLEAANGQMAFQPDGLNDEVTVNLIYTSSVDIDNRGRKIYTRTYGFSFVGIPNDNGNFVYDVVIEKSTVYGSRKGTSRMLVFADKQGETTAPISAIELTRGPYEWDERVLYHWFQISTVNEILKEAYRQVSELRRQQRH